jgi:hypothetical protein
VLCVCLAAAQTTNSFFSTRSLPSHINNMSTNWKDVLEQQHKYVLQKCVVPDFGLEVECLVEQGSQRPMWANYSLYRRTYSLKESDRNASSIRNERIVRNHDYITLKRIGFEKKAKKIESADSDYFVLCPAFIKHVFDSKIDILALEVYEKMRPP